MGRGRETFHILVERLANEEGGGLREDLDSSMDGLREAPGTCSSSFLNLDWKGGVCQHGGGTGGGTGQGRLEGGRGGKNTRTQASLVSTWEGCYRGWARLYLWGEGKVQKERKTEDGIERGIGGAFHETTLKERGGGGGTRFLTRRGGHSVDTRGLWQDCT